MFGYLAADTSHLTPEELARYKACYCGLCRSLQDRHGIQARLTLNYDMTFLILLLQSLYEPEEHGGDEPCLVHPFRSRPWQQSGITAYAADLNLALAYLKCLDNWEDDGSLLALGEAKALQKAYEDVCARYPRQCAVMQESLRELGTLEKDRREDPPASGGSWGSFSSGGRIAGRKRFAAWAMPLAERSMSWTPAWIWTGTLPADGITPFGAGTVSRITGSAFAPCCRC